MFGWAKNLFGGGGATNQQVQVATANQVAGGQGYGANASTTAGTTYQPVVPGGGNTGYGGGQGGFFSPGGGASMVLGGLQTVGALWNAYQQQKLAKESFEFQKDAYETNLKNSTQTYNTALEDRIRNRYDFSADHSQSDADKYIEKNKL